MDITGIDDAIEKVNTVTLPAIKTMSDGWIEAVRAELASTRALISSALVRVDRLQVSVDSLLKKLSSVQLTLGEP